MEWNDFLKFVLIEDIKNLIFYLRITQKDVYLISNTPNKSLMKPYGTQLNLKKKVPYEGKKDSEKISIINIKLVHQIFDTINICLLVMIFTLFFLSFDSQRKWSNTYKILSKTRAINNNLIDYISKIEAFYINKLESHNIYRKTKPEDLIYLEKLAEKKESLFKKNLSSFIEGFSDSKYQRGY